MPKSNNKRKNGKVKKYSQKDSSGKHIKARDLNHQNSIRAKQMMRMQLLTSACESLTSAEVQMAIDAGKGHEMSYVSTKLDEKGVPTEGDTLLIKLSNLDTVRLNSIFNHKKAGEKKMQENAESANHK
tara:strand:+ start:309 stop:692 length:384 start_codon:yes stop_codon:yes gene_type:complete